MLALIAGLAGLGLVGVALRAGAASLRAAWAEHVALTREAAARAERVAEARANVRRAIAAERLAIVARRIAVEERRIALEEAKVKAQAPSGDEGVPDDLFALANRESEEWAKDQVLAALREWYRDLKDWDQVRVRAKALVTPSETELLS